MRIPAQLVCILTAGLFVAIGSAEPVGATSYGAHAIPPGAQSMIAQCEAEFGRLSDTSTLVYQQISSP